VVLFVGGAPRRTIVLFAVLGAIFFWVFFVEVLGIRQPKGFWPVLWHKVVSIEHPVTAQAPRAPTSKAERSMEAISIALSVLLGGSAILAAFAGVAYGIVGGAMPGISPSVAMALLVPFTLTMDPTTAIILLASVYVGAEYGGSIPAISDQHARHQCCGGDHDRRIRAAPTGSGGEALGISLVAGVVGGLFGLLMLVALTEPLAKLALAFTPPAYFALGN